MNGFAADPGRIWRTGRVFDDGADRTAAAVADLHTILLQVGQFWGDPGKDPLAAQFRQDCGDDLFENVFTNLVQISGGYGSIADGMSRLAQRVTTATTDATTALGAHHVGHW